MRLATALGCAVNGGIFFAFSSFVMPAINTLGPEKATAAMNAMNVAAVRPAFMTVLFGTAALTVATGVIGVRQRDPLLIAGSAAFLVGAIGTTIGVNVPLNDALAAGTTTWADFYQRWMVANHVRALSGIAAAALVGAAAVRS
ncbi:DUF1772 domain-containing protein [Cellulomonas sp. URHD0024]|uniref:anthrone oxygenase family protein n=1 Tax=Cellulomonas sp. URHD0024 TaxID=1302620 RepID=UPI000415749F|nr:anthrone oxygenase family protein [Cellulomonas sp. URHD0024]